MCPTRLLNNGSTILDYSTWDYWIILILDFYRFDPVCVPHKLSNKKHVLNNFTWKREPFTESSRLQLRHWFWLKTIQQDEESKRTRKHISDSRISSRSEYRYWVDQSLRFRSSIEVFSFINWAYNLLHCFKKPKMHLYFRVPAWHLATLVSLSSALLSEVSNPTSSQLGPDLVHALRLRSNHGESLDRLPKNIFGDRISGETAKEGGASASTHGASWFGFFWWVAGGRFSIIV